ncbi:hypothetical protein HPP92_027639 [Vanilla planifolia]|uniref:Uncharacterized protein n=1 Tax=Vanilla planifolia TaxID=51239 RepID=A0A835PC53_VANPL|nr:hypothetical protein HPP92_027639 [Vanilla planifolia]
MDVAKLVKRRSLRSVIDSIEDNIDDVIINEKISKMNNQLGRSQSKLMLDDLMRLLLKIWRLPFSHGD